MPRPKSQAGVWMLGGGVLAALAMLGGRSKRAREALADGVDASDLIEVGRGIAEEAINMAENISRYFTMAEWIRSDTAQAHGVSNIPTPDARARMTDTSEMLDLIRLRVENKLMITSGYRSPALNQLLRGATDSQHVLGEAADIKCPALGTWQATPLAIAILDARIEFDQMIGYPPALGGHIHISFTARHPNRGEVLWSPAKKRYLPWNPHTQPNGEGVT